jgi:hypothetical protein
MAGDKYLKNNAGVITEVVASQTSAGAGDAGKIPALDSAGKLDNSLMPVGLATETDIIPASEALAAGDFVNIWTDTVAKVRKADGSTSGKEAHGFVLAAVESAANAEVYRWSQLNNQKTGLTPGSTQYLSITVPGGTQETVPTGAGKTLQKLGVAKSATELVFMPFDPIVLAA